MTAVTEATLRTIALGGSVAGLAGAAGLALAWLVARTDLPGRRVLAPMLSVPYALPPYLLGMAWVVLGNPTVGALRDFLPGSGIYGFWGMTWVMASVAFAFPFLEIRAGFDRLDPALEEAARMSGATPARVFRDVSLPLLWPSLLNGMCLAFLFSIAAFGVPALLGMPVREFVLTTLIYSQIRLGGMDGIAQGLTLSLLLLAMAGFVLGLSAWLGRMKNRRTGALGTGKSSRPGLVRLGHWRFPAAGVAWGFLGASVALPWFALAFSALAPVAGRYSPAEWTMKNLLYVIGLRDFHEALFNSAMLAAGVSTVVVSGGFLLAFAAVRRRQRWASALIDTLGIPFSTPGTVLALLLIMASTAGSRIGLPLDAPLLLMGVAYALKYSAVGARSMVNAYRQVHPSLEEAARVSGARTGDLLRTIWLPLLKSSLAAAWLLAALPMFTELTMSVLLTGPGAATLGTVLFQLQEYADQPSAAALAWMLLSAALAVGAWTAYRRKET